MVFEIFGSKPTGTNTANDEFGRQLDLQSGDSKEEEGTNPFAQKQFKPLLKVVFQ